MDRSRFEHICLEVEAGNDAFVTHSGDNEHGIVTGCVMKTDHIVVRTPEGEKRCWDFRECDDLHHTKSGPMVT